MFESLPGDPVLVEKLSQPDRLPTQPEQAGFAVADRLLR